MASDIKKLCRLCGKQEDISKDLLDENHKNVLKLIQDYLQIVVDENDVLPTKVCLNCEERIVSFQLFVLECYKVQNALRQLSIEDFEFKNEEEDLGVDYSVSLIKSEVKNEDTEQSYADNNDIDASVSEFEADDNVASFGDQIVDNSDYDVDNVTLADIKKEKETHKKGEAKGLSTAALVDILKKPYLKVKDFVKNHCDVCGYRAKTWTKLEKHFSKRHKTSVYVYCICGFVIKSKRTLYTHFQKHKNESEKILYKQKRQENHISEIKERIKVKDLIDFTCNYCNKKSSSWYSLKAHTQSVHKELPTVRCMCGVTLTSKSVLYKHVQDHRNPNKFRCDVCPKITKSLESLNKHKMMHLPKSERKFNCSLCDKIFNSYDCLKSHERSHIPIEERKIYQCDYCDLKFTTRTSAASHKRIRHEKIKSFICDTCGFTCGTNGELRQHIAIHSEDKPYVCRKCYKAFKTQSNLSTHMDTHEQTSYTCEICNRILNSRRTLRKHLLVHEEKCRYICSFCNKAFKRRQTLKVHLYTHTGDKPLTCKWCDERFSYASTLRSHRMRCHPDKMAAHSLNNTYQRPHYNSLANNSNPEDYIKADLEAIGIAKSAAEAM